jgi:superfamily II DNA or RNA helicase
MIYRTVGPVVASVSRDEVEAIGSTVPASVISIKTGFAPNNASSWNEYLDSITHSAERNLLIIDLATNAEGSVLILSDRIEHAEKLSTMLSIRKVDHTLAHGRLKAKDKAESMEKIKTAHITIGTTSLLGEGLDVSSWSVLVMASPISSEIKLLQAIGRVVRGKNGKKEALVYDLKDDCGFSGSSFKKRFEIYKKNNILVEFNKNKKAA